MNTTRASVFFLVSKIVPQSEYEGLCSVSEITLCVKILILVII